MKYVYPFQVPTVSMTAASRGQAPRDNFRVTTAEVEDDADGSATAQGQLGKAGVSANTLAEGEVWTNSEAAAGSEL